MKQHKERIYLNKSILLRRLHKNQKRSERNLLDNFKDIDENLTNQTYDPKNKYSIPYLWGSTALCYNAKYVKKN